MDAKANELDQRDQSTAEDEAKNGEESQVLSVVTDFMAQISDFMAQQSGLLAQLSATINQPKPAMRIVRDPTTNQVIGAEPVEAMNGA
jgi:hypothetical protein